MKEDEEIIGEAEESEDDDTDSWDWFEPESRSWGKVEKRLSQLLDIFCDDIKDMSEPTIGKHLAALNPFLFMYFRYEGLENVGEGIRHLDGYFHYFGYKCMWSNEKTVRQTVTALRKFYKCMLEHDVIEQKDYDELLLRCRTRIDRWIAEC